MANFKLIDSGIYIGSQPALQDLKVAKELGIQTVIDLRLPSEGCTTNEEVTSSIGLGYVGRALGQAVRLAYDYAGGRQLGD